MTLDSPADRLRWAREQHGKYSSPTAAARAFGWPVSTYLGHENGDRNPSRPAAKRYARAYRVRWEWLLEGEGAPRLPDRLVPVVGHVGADAEIYFAEGQGPFGEVQRPPGSADTAVAVEIRGESLGPFNGWFAYFEDRRDAPSRELVGQLCVVGLADGRVLIKRIAAGRKPRHFDLWGSSGAPLQDQMLTWAAPVTTLFSPAMAKLADGARISTEPSKIRGGSSRNQPALQRC
jgi:transcriptional regulator with XRE-family HTH domain